MYIVDDKYFDTQDSAWFYMSQRDYPLLMDIYESLFLDAELEFYDPDFFQEMCDQWTDSYSKRFLF